MTGAPSSSSVLVLSGEEIVADRVGRTAPLLAISPIADRLSSPAHENARDVQHARGPFVVVVSSVVQGTRAMMLV